MVPSTLTIPIVYISLSKPLAKAVDDSLTEGSDEYKASPCSRFTQDIRWAVLAHRLACMCFSFTGWRRSLFYATAMILIATNFTKLNITNTRVSFTFAFIPGFRTRTRSGRSKNGPLMRNQTGHWSNAIWSVYSAANSLFGPELRLPWPYLHALTCTKKKTRTKSRHPLSPEYVFIRFNRLLWPNLVQLTILSRLIYCWRTKTVAGPSVVGSSPLSPHSIWSIVKAVRHHLARDWRTMQVSSFALAENCGWSTLPKCFASLQGMHVRRLVEMERKVNFAMLKRRPQFSPLM